MRATIPCSSSWTLKGCIHLETELFSKLPRWRPVPEWVPSRSTIPADVPFPSDSRADPHPCRDAPFQSDQRADDPHLSRHRSPTPSVPVKSPTACEKDPPRLCYLCFGHWTVIEESSKWPRKLISSSRLTTPPPPLPVAKKYTLCVTLWHCIWEWLFIDYVLSNCMVFKLDLTFVIWVLVYFTPGWRVNKI